MGGFGSVKSTADPNGAKSRTARNPEERQIPRSAKSRRAPNPEPRRVAKGATTPNPAQ